MGTKHIPLIGSTSTLLQGNHNLYQPVPIINLFRLMTHIHCAVVVLMTRTAHTLTEQRTALNNQIGGHVGRIVAICIWRTSPA
jgi:hypothetical protein